jgi:hypothetical protein
VKARTLIRLYPRRWRERYGEEFEALVADRPLGARQVLDILFGALDARLVSQPPWTGAAGEPAGGGGHVMRILTSGCRGPELSRGEQLRGAVLTGASVILVSAGYVALNRIFGDNPWLEALGMAVFPFGLVVATIGLYFREHSLRARLLVGAAMLVVIYLGSLLAAWT